LIIQVPKYYDRVGTEFSEPLTDSGPDIQGFDPEAALVREAGSVEIAVFQVQLFIFEMCEQFVEEIERQQFSCIPDDGEP